MKALSLFGTMLALSGSVFGQQTPAPVPPRDFVAPPPALPADGAKPAAKQTAVQSGEMVARMRIAVEKIASEYGNPSFAQIFTNDPEKAAKLRERYTDLDKRDALKQEVASLTEQRDAARKELETLLVRSAGLREAVSKAQAALENTGVK